MIILDNAKKEFMRDSDFKKSCETLPSKTNNMVKEVMHIGLTVSDIDRSIAFYRDVLGLQFQGEILMEGPETDALFNRKNARCRVAYLKGTDDITSPPIELIQFTDIEAEPADGDLFRIGISEVCFYTPDIDAAYERLQAAGVYCLSRPQFFDFTSSDMGCSKAIYFKDPDGIILELMEPLQ